MTRLYYHGDIQRLDFERVIKKNYLVHDDKFEPGVTPEGVKYADMVTDEVINAIIVVEIVARKMQAKISMYPAVNGGASLNRAQLEQYLAKKENIDPRTIDHAALQKIMSLFEKNYIVENEPFAFGQAPSNGTDAFIKYHYERPKSLHDYSEAGRVDYRTLSTVINVTKDQQLVTIIPSTDGIDGYDVHGSEVPAKPGVNLSLVPLDNVRANETKTEFTSDIDGHVVVKNATIAVYPILIIKGNVDFRSGNIDFNGTVEVKQDVQSGFEVKADNIIVHGVVQDGVLLAKEDIEVKIGVKGSKKGLIQAGGEVTLGYAENAKIVSKKSIYIKKYAYNCELFAGDALISETNDTIIAGGHIKVFTEAYFQNLGTDENNSFTVEAGKKYDLEEKLKKVMEEKARITDSIAKIDEVLGQIDLKNPAILKNPKIRQLLETRSALHKKYEMLEKREEQIIKASTFAEPSVVVMKEMKENVKIIMHAGEFRATQSMKRVQFKYNKENEEVYFVQAEERMLS